MALADLINLWEFMFMPGIENGIGSDILASIGLLCIVLSVRECSKKMLDLQKLLISKLPGIAWGGVSLLNK